MPRSTLPPPELLPPAPAGPDPGEDRLARSETASGLSLATAQKVRAILRDGTAPATRRAHAGDVDYFWAWAALELTLPESYPAPAAAVLQFIVDHLEGLNPETEAALLERGRRRLPGGKARPGVHRLTTIRRRLASLSKAHQLAGAANPCALAPVRELLSRAGRREVRLGHGSGRKLAATREVLEALLASCGEDLAGRRDRALLLFGFASGGRRRSEIVAAHCEDLEPVADGYLFRLRHSKTDQAGEGLELPVLGRAAWALTAWLAAAGLSEGPVFRSIDRHGRLGRSLSDRAVALIVKRHAALAGFDPRLFGGHSLRSGFVTTAGRQGISLGDSMALSGHRSTAVALRYHQGGSALRNPAARLVE